MGHSNEYIARAVLWWSWCIFRCPFFPACWCSLGRKKLEKGCCKFARGKILPVSAAIWVDKRRGRRICGWAHRLWAWACGRSVSSIPELSQASWVDLVWFCFVVKNCIVGICLFGFDVPNLGCFRLVWVWFMTTLDDASSEQQVKRWRLTMKPIRRCGVLKICFNMFSKKVFNLLGNIVFNLNWSAGCGLHAEGELWPWLLLKAFDCQGCLHVLWAADLIPWRAQ